MKSKKHIAQEAVVERAVELAEHGLLVREIKETLEAEFGRTFWGKDVAGWTSEVRMRVQPGRLVRHKFVIFPDDADRNAYGMRNLFAHLIPMQKDRLPWRVVRGPVIDGERAYRVIPEVHPPFTVWAPTVGDFIRRLRKHGIEAVPYDPEEHEAPQAELFNIEAAAGWRLAA